ncbi:hypothetical protein [Streptomyces sp. NPDC000851]
MRRRGLTVTLVAAVERGLNKHELGAIIDFGMAHPAVRSVAFQPVSHSGRHVPFDPPNRLTNPDVIRPISEQLPARFTKGDFFPAPCCFPTCRSVTYLLVDGEPSNRTAAPVVVGASARSVATATSQSNGCSRVDGDS